MLILHHIYMHHPHIGIRFGYGFKAKRLVEFLEIFLRLNFNSLARVKGL